MTLFPYTTLFRSGEAIVPRIDRAIDLDDFSVHVKRSMSSTSCTDIFTIFNHSFEFIEGLRFSNEEINVKVISYVQLCVAAVRHYCKTMLGMIVSLYGQFSDKGTMALITSRTSRVLQREQCYVIVNDIVVIKAQWDEFTQRFIGNYAVDMGAFRDPLSGLVNQVKAILRLFALDLATEINKMIRGQLFVTKKSFGKVLSHVRHDALQLSVNWGHDINEMMRQRCDECQNSLISSYRNNLIYEFWRGVEIGLAESLVPFDDISAPDVFFGLVDSYGNIMTEVFESCRRNLEPAVIEYIQTKTEDFRIIEFLARVKDCSFEELKLMSLGMGDNRPQLFLVGLLMRQRKRSGTGKEKMTGFSFMTSPP
jgi:hypothetical protein